MKSVACDYCDSIEAMTGVRNCPIHGAAPPIAGTSDQEFAGRIDAARVTLEFGQKSTRRVDGGRRSIEDSPLFGGPRQELLFK